MISESPDKKWQVRVDEEGKFHWTDKRQKEEKVIVPLVNIV